MDVLCSPPQWVTPQRAVALGRHEGATAASAVPVPNISLITEFKSHLAPHEPSASAGHHQGDVTSLSHLLNESHITSHPWFPHIRLLYCQSSFLHVILVIYSQVLSPSLVSIASGSNPTFLS